MLRPAAADAERLRGHFARLRAAAEERPETIACAAPERMTGAIVRKLIACLTAAQPDRRDAGGRSFLVREAEQFLRRHIGDPVSIAQLSAIAGVSERSLRNAFHDVCTTSPKRYLRIWQLHQVRRALKARGRPLTTVTDVATHHGFFELGRFAGEYKAFFGEAPSETLHRTRVLAGSRDVA